MMEGPGINVSLDGGSVERRLLAEAVAAEPELVTIRRRLSSPSEASVQVTPTMSFPPVLAGEDSCVDERCLPYGAAYLASIAIGRTVSGA